MTNVSSLPRHRHEMLLTTFFDDSLEKGRFILFLLLVKKHF